MWIILLLAGYAAAEAEADAGHHAAPLHLGAAPYGHHAAPYCPNGGLAFF